MTTNTINVKADTLENAEKKMRTRIPAGYTLITSKVIYKGEEMTLEADGETIEVAVADLESRIPDDSEEIMREVDREPERNVIRIEADSEKEAKRAIIIKWEGIARKNIKSIRLLETGRKGLLGIGKKCNSYEVETFIPAKVRIKFKPMAEISFVITDWEDNHEALNALVDELYMIARADHCYMRVLGDERSFDRSKYYMNGGYYHIRARQIGEMLYKGGGTALMRKACYAIYDKVGAGEGNQLAHLWSGIGGWMP